ncbi:hypothetical protein [Gordonia sp. CPCC 205333]|uniref:hypothetical protein n=1 Tax=Gordonia sp. CPCC 205333 TaxID=3140790 RepID=UPI003AF33C60
MMPDDAQAYWLARKTRSDQFLLFVFDPIGVDVDDVVSELLLRADRIDDLNLVVRETFADFDYPYWDRARARRDQFGRREQRLNWRQCLDDVAGLIGDQLDPRQAAWRVHLYPDVDGAPDGRGPGSVAVLQISHALADGTRSTALARQLFGVAELPPSSSTDRERPIGIVSAPVGGLLRLPSQLADLVTGGRRAYELSKREPAGSPSSEAGPLNASPGNDRQLHVIVTTARALRIGTHSITVGAIIAMSRALVDAEILGAEQPFSVELTIARDGPSLARNNFYNAAVDAHPSITDLNRRAAAVAASIDDARRRDRSPAKVASRAAAASTPALLMHWGARAFDPTVRSPTVTGNTVVSSVNRGDADLRLGDGAVRFTTGFPAISTMQGLTHGVHGIGGAVAISVTTSRIVLPDVEGYLRKLESHCGGEAFDA